VDFGINYVDESFDNSKKFATFEKILNCHYFAGSALS
jgi:hypothetical protein